MKIILILLISILFTSCSTLQRYSISRTELFNKRFDCDSVVISMTDSTQKRIKTSSIQFFDNSLLCENSTVKNLDLSSIMQVKTIRKQSYNGDILGVFIGGAAALIAKNLAPGISRESDATLRNVFIPLSFITVGWLIGRNPRTEYQITVTNSPQSIPPSSLVYTDFFGRYNTVNFTYEPLLSYDSTALWGMGVRSAVQTGLGIMVLPVSYGFRLDIPIIPLVVVGKEYGFEVGAGISLQYWAKKYDQFYELTPRLSTKFIKPVGHFGYRYCSFTSNTKLFRITITPTLEENYKVAWMAGFSLIL